MQAPSGGCFSSFDAYSEGEEAKFYVWGRAELQHLLTQEEFDVLTEKYGFNNKANFEGQWYPNSIISDEELCRRLSNPSQEQTLALLSSGKQKLFEVRKKCIATGRDDKILTSWNALMIKGMASSALYQGRHHCAQSAERALNYLKKNHWKDGRLLATSKDNQINTIPAYLDDYAFLVDAILRLLQYRWNSSDPKFCVELAEIVIERFEDSKRRLLFYRR